MAASLKGANAKAMFSALIEKVYLLLPFALNRDCEKTYNLLSKFTLLADQEKDRRLARPCIDEIQLESLLGGKKR
jgi:hypothetical protein